METILVLVFALIGGIFIGIALEAQRWRDNADMIQSIESQGRLYKVTQI
jgi:hypothetical protein